MTKQQQQVVTEEKKSVTTSKSHAELLLFLERGNLWLSGCCLTTTPIIPKHWPSWQGPRGAATQQHLEGNLLATSELTLQSQNR